MLDYAFAHWAEMPFFLHLSGEVREALLLRGRIRSFSRGETICLQGETPKSLKIVLAGWVKCYRVTPQGEEAILATLTSGHSFDEIAALHGTGSLSSVEAVSDCAVLFIDINGISDKHDAYPDLNRAILAVSAVQMQEMMTELERMKVQTTVERLVHYLVGRSDVRAGRVRIELPYSKVILASVLGMKPESLSRAFKALQAEGVQCHHNEVIVEDMAGLRKCLGDVAEVAFA